MTKTSMRTGGPVAGLVGALVVALIVGTAPARAQSRAETLRYVTGAAVNTLDPTMPGTTREAFAISLSTYDRLVTFGRKKLGDNWVFDLDTVRGELAERYEVSPDGLTLTFYLRKDAKFQDGTPVTAEDVKWSLDRAVSAKSLAGPQLLTGSLTSPDQFTLTIGLQYLSGTFSSDQRLIAAGSMIAFIPIAIVFAVLQRFFFKGVEEGGVKG